MPTTVSATPSSPARCSKPSRSWISDRASALQRLAYLHGTAAHTAQYEGREQGALKTRSPSKPGFQGSSNAVSSPGVRVGSRWPTEDYLIDDGEECMLKSGILCADHVNTVSPTYTAEIKTPEHGCRLDAALRSRGSALSGILNGIDTLSGTLRVTRSSEGTSHRRILRGRGSRKGSYRRVGMDSGWTYDSRHGHPPHPQKGLDLVIGALDGRLTEDCPSSCWARGSLG